MCGQAGPGQAAPRVGRGLARARTPPTPLQCYVAGPASREPAGPEPWGSRPQLPAPPPRRESCRGTSGPEPETQALLQRALGCVARAGRSPGRGRWVGALEGPACGIPESPRSPRPPPTREEAGLHPLLPRSASQALGPRGVWNRCSPSRATSNTRAWPRGAPLWAGTRASRSGAELASPGSPVRGRHPWERQPPHPPSCGSLPGAEDPAGPAEHVACMAEAISGPWTRTPWAAGLEARPAAAATPLPSQGLVVQCLHWDAQTRPTPLLAEPSAKPLGPPPQRRQPFLQARPSLPRPPPPAGSRPHVMVPSVCLCSAQLSVAGTAAPDSGHWGSWERPGHPSPEPWSGLVRSHLLAAARQPAGPGSGPCLPGSRERSAPPPTHTQLLPATRRPGPGPGVLGAGSAVPSLPHPRAHHSWVQRGRLHSCLPSPPLCRGKAGGSPPAQSCAMGSQVVTGGPPRAQRIGLLWAHGAKSSLSLVWARLLGGRWAAAWPLGPSASSDRVVPVELGRPEPCPTPPFPSRSPWRADPG